MITPGKIRSIALTTACAISQGTDAARFLSVASVDEMIDTSKQYILNNTGTVWKYGEIEIDDTDRNLFDATTVTLNQNSDGTARNGSFITDYIPLGVTEATKNTYWVTLRGSAAKPYLDKDGNTLSRPYIYKIEYYNESKELLSIQYSQFATYAWDSSIPEFKFKSNSVTLSSGTEQFFSPLVKYVRILVSISANPISAKDIPIDLIITTPEKKTKIVLSWHDTGMSPYGFNTNSSNELLTKINTNTTAIENTNNRIQRLEDINNSDSVPTYWDDPKDTVNPSYLSKRIETIRSLQDNAGHNMINFCWFSDLHYNGSARYVGNLGVLCAKVMDSCHIPFALMSGDTLTATALASVNDVKTKLNAAWDLYSPIGADRLMLVRGNHDDVYGSPI